jgi:phosphoribosylformylglycinamidine synthase
LADVRQGKQFVLSVDGEITDSKLSEIKKITETLLSNPVIEDFSVEVKQ